MIDRDGIATLAVVEAADREAVKLIHLTTRQLFQIKTQTMFLKSRVKWEHNNNFEKQFEIFSEIFVIWSYEWQKNNMYVHVYQQ